MTTPWIRSLKMCWCGVWSLCGIIMWNCVDIFKVWADNAQWPTVISSTDIAKYSTRCSPLAISRTICAQFFPIQTLQLVNKVYQLINFTSDKLVWFTFRTIDRNHFTPVIHIAPVPRNESKTVHLVAITQAGMFFTLSTLSAVYLQLSSSRKRLSSQIKF